VVRDVLRKVVEKKEYQVKKVWKGLKDLAESRRLQSQEDDSEHGDAVTDNKVQKTMKKR